MPPSRASRTRRRLFVLAAPVLVLLAVVGWVIVDRDGGDGDGLGALRELPAVTAAARDDGEVDVRMRANASGGAVAEALDRVPDGPDGGTVRLGRALLDFEGGGGTETDVLGTFVAVSRVKAPGGTIGIDRRSGGWGIEAEVERIEQAAPLAREIVARVAPRGRPLSGFGRLEVALAGAPQAEQPPVVLRLLGQADRRVAIAVSTPRPRSPIGSRRSARTAAPASCGCLPTA